MYFEQIGGVSMYNHIGSLDCIKMIGGFELNCFEYYSSKFHGKRSRAITCLLCLLHSIINSKRLITALLNYLFVSLSHTHTTVIARCVV